MKRLSNKVHYSDKVYDNDKVKELLKNESVIHEWMDEECVDLCDALNSIKGISTIESCCGHNSGPYRIFFKCSSLNGLKFIQSCIDRRYWKYGHKWDITTTISDCDDDQLDFVLSSKSTNLKMIMVQVESMIDTLNYYLNHKNRFSFLGLSYNDFTLTETN